MRRIHTLHFIRFGGPKSPKALLITSEIAALREIVVAYAAGGPIRNRDMAVHLLKSGPPFGLFSFWDGVSRGTKDMIDVAAAAGIPVRVVRI